MRSPVQQLLSIRNLRYGAWGLAVLVACLAFYEWGSSWQWQLGTLSTYQIFPIFGLMAFSLMWAQYVVNALATLLKLDQALLGRFYSTMGYLVLIAIVLHPGLLVWQLWHDGFGLPPESYLRHYVAPGLGWVALIGTVSLFVFLAYELHRWFGNRRWWRFVEYASNVAMLGIFYHALRLGTQVSQPGWFHVLWLFYGVVLIVVLAYKYGKMVMDKRATARTAKEAA